MSRQTRCARRRAPSATAGFVAIAALMLIGGCATSKLDTAGAEGQITAKLRSLYPSLQVGETTCPGQVHLGSGRTFTCTVLVAGKDVHVIVRQDDGHGKVSFRTREYLLQPEKAATYVRNATLSELGSREKVDPANLPAVRVECGTGPLVLVPQPGRFDCKVTTPSGTYTEVGEVADDGTITYTVPNPPSTTPATPAAAPPATPTS